MSLILGGLTNTELREMPVNVSDTFFTASNANRMDGHEAYVLQVNGRRKGWADITSLQDLVEYNSNTLISAPEPNGVNLEVVSTSPNDTVLGTGIRKIYITYLDSTGAMIRSAPISMNGTTPVNVGTAAYFIQGSAAWDVGSGLVAAGTITFREVATPTVIHEQISPGANSSLSGRFKVPANWTAYCSTWSARAINNDQDVRILSTALKLDRSLSNQPTAFPVYHTESSLYQPINTGAPDALPWLKFPEGCRIKIASIPAGAGTTIRADATMTLLLVKNIV